jgi:hypothetical protein
MFRAARQSDARMQQNGSEPARKERWHKRPSTGNVSWSDTIKNAALRVDRRAALGVAPSGRKMAYAAK